MAARAHLTLLLLCRAGQLPVAGTRVTLSPHRSSRARDLRRSTSAAMAGHAAALPSAVLMLFTSSIGGKHTACPVAATTCATSASAISARLTRYTRQLQLLLCGQTWRASSAGATWRAAYLPRAALRAQSAMPTLLGFVVGSPLPCARVMRKRPARHTGPAQRRVLRVLMPPRWTQRPNTPLVVRLCRPTRASSSVLLAAASSSASCQMVPSGSS